MINTILRFMFGGILIGKAIQSYLEIGNPDTNFLIMLCCTIIIKLLDVEDKLESKE
jgi:hypothetical protein